MLTILACSGVIILAMGLVIYILSGTHTNKYPLVKYFFEKMTYLLHQ